jgi:hypothetical protein
LTLTMLTGEFHYLWVTRELLRWAVMPAIILDG